MDYFLSGHGGTGVGQHTLKSGLVTFCPIGSTLDVPTSWKIFDLLAAGNLGGLAPYIHHRYAAGQTVPDMKLFPTTDFTSGIFAVGGGKIARRALDGGQFTLRDFTTMYRDAGTVYWVACLS